jgi:hypothetical protein
MSIGAAMFFYGVTVEELPFWIWLPMGCCGALIVMSQFDNITRAINENNF